MFLIVQNQPEPRRSGVAAASVSLPPEWQAIVDYFEAGASDRLPMPATWPSPDGRLRFRRRVAMPADGVPTPAISSVRLVNLDGDGRLELVATDMRHGLVLTARPYDVTPVLKTIAQVPHPSHVEPVDFDGDGVLDLLVGDLGAFEPTDSDRGAVLWLRGRKDGTYAQLTLEGWPPVADVQAADFDGDGRLDLAVAAFGWRKTGAFTILKNDTTDYDRPGFIPFKIEERTGAIHAPPVDLNRDGRPDVVVLFAQEHEMVVAFLNTGPGIQFERQILYQAPHPMWGSSGLQVVDIDGDGDLDVLLTNGDSFDDHVPKAYHGITWLENRGTYPFVVHVLATLGGAHRAQAADLDGDGDLDIIASALVAQQTPEAASLPALVWLEQTSRGRFERRTLEVGLPTHATLDVGDFDGDGDVDLVVGNFSAGPPKPAWIDIWENLQRSPPADRR